MDYLGEITEQNFVMQRGDSKSWTITLNDANGDQIVLTTGDEIVFTAKKLKTQETPDIEKSVTTFNDGSAIVYLVPADTDDLDVATYQYDMQWNHSTDKYTVLKGKLKIEEDVTRD